MRRRGEEEGKGWEKEGAGFCPVVWEGEREREEGGEGGNGEKGVSGEEGRGTELI